MKKRMKSLFEEIKNNNVDAFLITATPNIRYIARFTGEDAYLLVTDEKIYLIVDSRFTTHTYR